jgi:5-methylcytosine-specific restriction protein A
LDGLTPTKLNDLALVCSNCHRMLHRAKPLLLPDELRSIRWCDDA